MKDRAYVISLDEYSDIGTHWTALYVNTWTFPWTYVINDLNGGEIIGTFYEKESQKINKKKLE